MGGFKPFKPRFNIQGPFPPSQQCQKHMAVGIPQTQCWTQSELSPQAIGAACVRDAVTRQGFAHQPATSPRRPSTTLKCSSQPSVRSNPVATVHKPFSGAQCSARGLLAVHVPHCPILCCARPHTLYYSQLVVGNSCCTGPMPTKLFLDSASAQLAAQPTRAPGHTASPPLCLQHPQC